MWESVEGVQGTERMPVPGGMLYRSVWRHQMGVGMAALDGSAMVFVPAVEITHTDVSSSELGVTVVPHFDALPEAHVEETHQ